MCINQPKGYAPTLLGDAAEIDQAIPSQHLVPVSLAMFYVAKTRPSHRGHQDDLGECRSPPEEGEGTDESQCCDAHTARMAREQWSRRGVCSSASRGKARSLSQARPDCCSRAPETLDQSPDRLDLLETGDELLLRRHVVLSQEVEADPWHM